MGGGGGGVGRGDFRRPGAKSEALSDLGAACRVHLSRFLGNQMDPKIGTICPTLL